MAIQFFNMLPSYTGGGRILLNRLNLGKKRLPEFMFALGDVFVHKKHSYKGVIYARDDICRQGEYWVKMMGVDQLERGRNQPFYHVLVDSRDRPRSSFTYVAEENIEISKPEEPIIENPLLKHMFEGFDYESRRYIPTSRVEEEAQRRIEENMNLWQSENFDFQ